MTNAKHNVTAKFLMKMKLSEAQNHRCAYCHDPMVFEMNDKHGQLNRKWFTTDHVIPKSLGGIDHESNYVIACHDCNNLRGHANAEVFYYCIQTYGYEGIRKNIRTDDFMMALFWSQLAVEQPQKPKIAQCKVHTKEELEQKRLHKAAVQARKERHEKRSELQAFYEHLFKAIPVEPKKKKKA